MKRIKYILNITKVIDEPTRHFNNIANNYKYFILKKAKEIGYDQDPFELYSQTIYEIWLKKKN